MITHFASGGLGNQLFNYAAARTLADRIGTELVIDVDSYRKQWTPDASRPFLLHHFPVRARFRNFGPLQDKLPIWQRGIRWLREDAFTKQVRRDSIGYFSEFADLPSRTILRDHYISPRFFEGNVDRIRCDFRLSNSILNGDATAIALLASIERSLNPVFVHVRRGDFLYPENSSHYLPVIEQYYFTAMAMMAEHFVEPAFFCFSDDPAWCRDRFTGLPYDITFVGDIERPAANPLSDFYLMSQCKGSVIANSGFSWWAAWLCNYPSKKVVVPYIFDAANRVPMDDLIPAAWTRVKW